MIAGVGHARWRYGGWVLGVVVTAWGALRIYTASLREAGVRRRTGVDQACSDHVPGGVDGWQLEQDFRWVPPELRCTWTDPATAQSITVNPTQSAAVVYFWLAVLLPLALLVVLLVLQRRRRRSSTD